MNINLTTISTEQRNINTVDIDSLNTLDILKKINHEDKQIAFAIEKSYPILPRWLMQLINVWLEEGSFI